MSTAYFCLFGLIIGSFLNVCIYRIPEGRTVVKGHSMCMSCSHTLGGLDLIPLFSWIFLRGKCRYCGAPVSSRYAKIEGLTGAIFGLFAYLHRDRIYWPGDPAEKIVPFLVLILLLAISATVIVAMMIQKDQHKGIMGAPIVIGGIILFRFGLLVFAPDKAGKTILLSVAALGIAVSAVAVAVLLSAKKTRIRAYFSPEGAALRISDALFISICAAIGFPAALVSTAVYISTRLFFKQDKALPMLGVLCASSALFGVLLMGQGVF
jgi:prepilin signal peptidase PulO-like enzyme (type II secretory pathway)